MVAPVNARGEVAFFATPQPRRRPTKASSSGAGTGSSRWPAKATACPASGACPASASTRRPALSDGGLVAFAAAVAGGKAVEGIFAWSAGRLRAGRPHRHARRRACRRACSPGSTPRPSTRGATSCSSRRSGAAASRIDAILAQRAAARCARWWPRATPRPPVAPSPPSGPPVDQRARRGGLRRGRRGQGGAGRPLRREPASGSRWWWAPERTRRSAASSPSSPSASRFNDAGVIAFHGMLKFAPVAAAIFAVEDGRTRAVARLGDPAPGGGTIAHFGLWPAVEPAGAIAFAASIEGGPSPVAHPDRRRRRPRPGRRGRRRAPRRRSHRHPHPLPGRQRERRAATSPSRWRPPPPARGPRASSPPRRRRPLSAGAALSSCRRADTR